MNSGEKSLKLIFRQLYGSTQQPHMYIKQLIFILFLASFFSLFFSFHIHMYINRMTVLVPCVLNQQRETLYCIQIKCGLSWRWRHLTHLKGPFTDRNFSNYSALSWWTPPLMCFYRSHSIVASEISYLSLQILCVSTLFFFFCKLKFQFISSFPINL